MKTIKMKLVRTTLCSLVFMTLLALTGQAATYYVAPADQGGADGNPGTKEQPFLTLNAAVTTATAGDTILLADGTNSVSSTVEITKQLTIASESGDRDKCVLDGGNACRIISASSALTLSGVTMQRGRATDALGGAALYFGGGNTLTITNCLISDCHVSCETSGKVSVRGGGLYANCSAASVIVDTEIEGCTVSLSSDSTSADCGGGGACLVKGTMRSCIVRDCAVTNTSPIGTSAPVTLGGGLLIAGSSRVLSTVVSNCVVASTSSAFGSDSIGGAGGGVAFRSADGSVVDCLVAGNISDCAGGGIYLGAAGVVSNCTIRANEMSWPRSCAHAGAGGAGIASYNANATIVGCLVENNSATNATSLSETKKSVSGGVSVFGGSVYMAGSVVRDNAAYNVGGVRLYRTVSGTCVSNVVITGNRSWEQSGGIRAENVRAIQLRDLVVTDNVQSYSVSKPYGVLYISVEKAENPYTEILVRNCLFAGNQMAGNNSCSRWGVYVAGGGYRAEGADPITFDHCTFARNSTAAITSSAFFNVGNQATAGNVRIIGCAVYGNTGNGSPVGIGGESCDWSLLGDLVQYSLCDVIQNGFSVTADNHNVDASSIEASALFANADGGDYRPANRRSALVDAGGPFEDWMGTGNRKSVQDIGDGTYSLLTAETYGVSVVRNGTSPRRQGSASDIGCNEFREAPGFCISFR